MKKLLLALSVGVLSACQPNALRSNPAQSGDSATAPGAAPVWAYSGKTGIGSSYERYVDGEYRHNADTGAVSKVWFSLAEGIVTETMFGLIHQAQIKETIVLSNVFEWAASV